MPYGLYFLTRVKKQPYGEIMEKSMKITDSKKLGQAIRSRRKELHYTQAYLSEFTGLSITFISDLERGKPTAEIEKTIRLINILGLDLLVEKR